MGNLMINKILDMQKEISGKVIDLKDLIGEKTALIVVDMVNGFVHQGLLSSPRVVKIINNLVNINERTKGYKKIFFLDRHDENSVEFKNYSKHCLKDTIESELIPSLREEVATLHSNTRIIPKNSTNGFHAPGFKVWLQENEEHIENYIIVPADSVETFDFGTHDGDLMKVISLWEMQSNGIEVVDNII